MKEMERSTYDHEQMLNRLDIQTRVAVMWVQSEPRFSEEIDTLGGDSELASYALEKFVDSGMAEKFELFYDSDEVKKLAFEINQEVLAINDDEKEKKHEAFEGAVAQKIFEMIKNSK